MSVSVERDVPQNDRHDEKQHTPNYSQPEPLSSHGSQTTSTKDIFLSNSKSSKSLIPFKLGFFLVISSHGVISSFIPLYFKQVGLNPGQIGLVMLFRPMGGFFGGMLAPIISQKVAGEESTALTFSILFLVSTFSIGLLGHAPLATDCSNLDTVRLSSFTHENKSMKSFCSRAWLYESENLWQLVVFMGILLFLSDLFLVGMDSIQHGVTMRSLGAENTKSFGTVRAWGCLGYAVAAISTGIMVNATSSEENICSQLFRFADYHFLFYTFLVFSAGNVLNVGNVFKVSEIDEKHRGQRAMPHKELRKALCTFKNSSWMMVLFCRSMFFAVTQGFLNWHLENIGASPALIGSANCVTTTTEFVMFFATPKFIDIFGHTKLVSAGIISYICRFIIFSQISNPIFILPVEVMEGVMFACIWSSIVSYLSNQVPEEGQTQVQGVIQALYMLGTGVGFPISGVLTQIFGTPIMFLTFAGLAAVTFVVFVLAEVTSHCDKDSAPRTVHRE